jgi:chemotaxis-related protein WspB
MPQSDSWIRGLLNYSNRPVPVIDLPALILNRPVSESLSDRINLVNGKEFSQKDGLIGLLAEDVVTVHEVKDEEINPPGLELKETTWQGDVIIRKGKMVQLVQINQLIPDSHKEILFDQSTLQSLLENN